MTLVLLHLINFIILVLPVYLLKLSAVNIITLVLFLYLNTVLLVCFDSYVPVNLFSVMSDGSSCVEPILSSR